MPQRVKRQLRRLPQTMQRECQRHPAQQVLESPGDHHAGNGWSTLGQPIPYALDLAMHFLLVCIHFRGIANLGQGIQHGLRVHTAHHHGAAALEVELRTNIAGQLGQRRGRLGDVHAAYGIMRLVNAAQIPSPEKSDEYTCSILSIRRASLPVRVTISF